MTNPNHEQEPVIISAAERADRAFIKRGLGESEPILWRIDELRFAAINTDEYDDNVVELIFRLTISESEEDKIDAFAILSEYRPELSDRIAKEMRGE